MDEAARRGKFSILYWPSLYSFRAILALQLIFVLLAGFAMMFFHISRQSERQLLSRASERTRAIMALKLSGVETWQWRRELRCENSAADCLKMKISFTAPKDAAGFTEKISIAEPCKICHEKMSTANTTVYANFETVPAGIINRTGEWIVLSLIAAAAAGFLVYLLSLRIRRLKAGVCVAAFEHDPSTEKEVKNFLKTLLNSRRYSYYAEIAPRRLRLVTSPEKFYQLLNDFSGLIERNRGSLRAVALHVDLRTASIIPVDSLRGAYQFLSHIPQRTYLVHDRLADEFPADNENGRRLVFKNKSGASLKFIPWELK